MIPELVVTAALMAPVLDEIERCESGGRNVMNYMHTSNPSYYTTGGYYQITNGTWRDFGGTAFAPTAIEASKAQQKIVAQRILAARGTQPWDASKGCWEGKTSADKDTTVKHSSGKAAKESTKQSKPRHTKTYTVWKGDTLSSIAAKHGTNWRDLYQKNSHLSSPDIIYPGDTIYL